VDRDSDRKNLVPYTSSFDEIFGKREFSFYLIRKEAQREFRRLYHLEEKRRQQLLNRHEYEIEEQRQDFRYKREELIKKYDLELQTIEQKHKIEIDRENVLLTNEYNKKLKQIRLG